MSQLDLDTFRSLRVPENAKELKTIPNEVIQEVLRHYSNSLIDMDAIIRAF